MDSEIEKYVEKQSQLSGQIKKLFAEKKILEDKICVLNECLSLEKVKEKIVQLENKQKILTTLESMVNNLKVEIKPLDYLKQLLHRELMVSTLPTTDCNIEEKINIESPVLKANSECEIEILDSLSNVSSEESVMILSEYDVVSDEDNVNNIEQTVENKVMYDEALQMASSIHLTVETPITDTESISSSDQMKDVNFVLLTSKNMIASMNSSIKSEPLEKYSVVNKQDLYSNKENEEIEFNCNNKIFESNVQKTDQLLVFDKESLDNLKKHDDLSKSMNDSWVKIESLESSMENKVQTQNVEYNMLNEQLCSQQSESKDAVSLINTAKENIEIISPLSDSKYSCVFEECDEKQENIDVEAHVKNYQSCSYLSESRDSEVQLKNVCDELEYNYTNLNSNGFTCSTDTLKNTTDNDLSAYINKDEKTIQSCSVVEFDTNGLDEELRNGIHHTGIHNLKTSQLECISHFINGCNVFLHSYPCVGKSTMSFISVLQKIDTSLDVCQAIILVPTLELELFSLKMIKSLGQFSNVSITISSVYNPEVSPFYHILISTPHNLCDIIGSNSLCKDFIKMLVIDDTDEMLKINTFFNEMRKILLFLNNDRQLIILSSSKFDEILDFFSDTMSNPEYIIMTDERPSLDSILQYYICLPDKWKYDVISELYDVLNVIRTVVFCNTWSKSQIVADQMRFKTYTVSAANINMDSKRRRHILRQFQTGISKVLVTTGLLKGEDLTDVMCIINYDLPKNPKDYVRRIVSCFNCRVKVINFISPNDKPIKENIETELNVRMLNLPQDITDIRVASLTFFQ